MAESDIAMKQYMSAKHRFADFFNVFTFGGRQIIKPDQLTPVDSESGIIAWCNKAIERNLAGMSKSEIQTAKRTLWRHRDIIMEWIVDINKIDNLSLFRSDLGLVFGLVQCRDSKEKTRQFANEHKDFFEAVDYETMNAISVITNGGDKFARLMGDGKKVYNMCKAYQEIYEEGVEHGWNNGRNDGIRKSIILLRNVGTADDLIANMIMTEYNISAEEVQSFMNAVTNI